MIHDNIQKSDIYVGLNPHFEAAFEFLKRNDLSSLKNGRYEIEGDVVFALVQDYQSKPLSEGVLEAHKKYIDVQYIICGEEKFGYAQLDNTNPCSDYDEEKDIVFLKGEANFVSAKQGDFLIFYPFDAHMPSICVDNQSNYVKKVVIKVRAH